MKKKGQDIERVIEIRDLYKSFGTLDILKGVDLDVYKGENMVVLGKSGAGKSVLIKLIAGLLPYDKGSIKVLGQEVAGLAVGGRDRQRAGVLLGILLADSLQVADLPHDRLDRFQGIERTE